MSILAPEVIRAVERHTAVHEANLCSCPCFDALFHVAREMPRIEAAARVNALLNGPTLENHRAGELPDCSPLLCGHPANAEPSP